MVKEMKLYQFLFQEKFYLFLQRQKKNGIIKNGDHSLSNKLSIKKNLKRIRPL